jgi:hypothetical protein
VHSGFGPVGFDFGPVGLAYGQEISVYGPVVLVYGPAVSVSGRAGMATGPKEQQLGMVTNHGRGLNIQHLLLLKNILVVNLL